MSSPKEDYSAIIDSVIQERAIVQKKLSVIFRARIVLGIALVVAIVLGFASKGEYFYFLIPAFAGLIYFAGKHAREKARETIFNVRLQLNEDELRQLDGGNDVFNAEPNIDYRNHVYANDLDIFGSFSLFTRINRTNSLIGKFLVAHDLLHPLKDPARIKLQREAIQELAPYADWRQDYITTGSLQKEKPTDTNNLNKWNAQPQFFKNKKEWLYISAFSCALIFLALLIVIFSPASVITFIGAAFILNQVVYRGMSKSISGYFQNFPELKKLFTKWSELASLIEKHPFTSETGMNLQERARGSAKAFKELANLNGLLAFRHGGMLILIMNGLMLFDVWYILQIEQWRKKYGARMEDWIDAFGEMDMLVSYANYQFNNPGFCQAEIIEGAKFMKATQMGHPLLAKERAICNDFIIGNDAPAIVITGSNMSGKSTFLRTVGLNLVLALNGLPVCAKSFSCSPLLIASCIRVNDSLEASESYFKAEINKLSEVKKLLETGESYIILLDEILRGTNSNDKNAGTRSFYLKIRDFKCLALLATHDVEIGQLAHEFPASFQNYHFESYIHDADITFDYLLRPGISTTRNATTLLRNMGLID